MRATKIGLLACGFGLCLLAPASAGAGQDDSAAAAADFVRTELVLDFRTVRVAFETGLDAVAEAHRALLADDQPRDGARIRLGALEANSGLRFGDAFEVESLDGGSASSRFRLIEHPLWLARENGAWRLDLHAAPDGDAADDDPVGSVPLSQEAAGGPEQAVFSAGLTPVSDDAGQLVLRWGSRRWTADFHFPESSDEDDDAAEEEDEPEEEEEDDEEPRVANDQESLQFDSDRSLAYRIARLAERNETALTLPDDSRIAVLVWQGQSVEHADFEAIASLGDGAVVRLTEGAVLRLRSEVPLQFGGVTVETGNLAPGFAASYGLWLKRAGEGWRLVFNDEADAWGTQHDPSFDAAEIALEHSADGLATRSLGAALVPVTERAGQLRIHWGPHDWVADFTVSE